KEYVKNSVVARVVLRDISMEFGIKDFELIESMLKLIFSNPGLIFNFNLISKSFKKSRMTISNYLNYLKYGLAVKILSNYRKSILATSRKFKKVYPATTSFTFAYSNLFYEKEFFGKVLETYVINALNANFYFRKNNKEIDAILEKNKKLLPIEVKESMKEKDIEKFLKTLKELNLEEGIIVTLEEFNEKIVKNKKIRILPAWYLDFFEF
ncbi:MAG: DUF4143 domain-containing protein, partial [Candidatus Bathyarchaeia archaeon]